SLRSLALLGGVERAGCLECTSSVRILGRTTMVRPIVVLFAAPALSACGEGPTSKRPAEAAAAPSLVEAAKLDATLREFVESGQLLGVSALVYERGREAYFGAFGVADREANRPMRRDTLV